MSKNIDPASPPFWHKAPAVSKGCDPKNDEANLSTRLRLGSVEEARACTRQTVEILHAARSLQTRALRKLLSSCVDGDCICAQPFCQCCSRKFRRWLGANLLKFTENPVYKYAVQITAPFHRLSDIDMPGVHNQMRDYLRQEVGAACMVVGGSGVSYSEQLRTWALRINFVIYTNPDAVRRFKKACRQEHTSWTVVTEEFHGDSCRDFQISGVVKPMAFNWPNAGQPGGSNFSESEWQTFAIIEWLAERDFDDFLFLKGAHLQGNKIIRVKPR